MKEITRVTVEDGISATPFERVVFDDGYILGHVFAPYPNQEHLTHLVMYLFPGEQISVYVSNDAVDDVIDQFRRLYLALNDLD